MLKKIFLLAAFAITPLLLSESASAQCYPGGYYGGHSHYRVPVYSHRVVHHRYGYGYGHRSLHRYGALYGSPYRHGHVYGRYGVGYRGYGVGYGHPYRRGTAIGIGRGGVGISIGF